MLGWGVYHTPVQEHCLCRVRVKHKRCRIFTTTMRQNAEGVKNFEVEPAAIAFRVDNPAMHAIKTRMLPAMTTADYLTTINIVVAIIGALLVVGTLYEAHSLRKLKLDFEQLRKDMLADIYKNQQAAHKIIASYNIADPVARITLIKQAIELDATTFNAYNSLGYAWLELGDNIKAADAFRYAIHYHPSDKAGYCDLATAYMRHGDIELCAEYLRKAIAVDPSAESDIRNDSRFNGII